MEFDSDRSYVVLGKQEITHLVSVAKHFMF